MSHSITLKSFAELAEALNIEELMPDEDEAPVEQLQSSGNPAADNPDLKALLADLETASATLATIVRRDEEARAVAMRDLERYDSLVARRREAEQAQERASQVRREAERLSEGAFAEEARARAAEVVRTAIQAEIAAIDATKHWKREAEQLAAQLDLERLLAERRRLEEAEKAKAAEAEKARRLAGALARARAALEAGRDEEAQGLLGHLAKDFPGNPEISSLRTIIAQREMAVKVSAAEDALWEARRLYRREPADAVTRLERLDIDGLPEPLARQVFGEWARACARLCRECELVEPLRYAPDPGRGAVIAREQADGSYVVISALGMGAGWNAGSAVSERYVRRARPLR
jgi:hypothetical protein